MSLVRMLNFHLQKRKFNPVGLFLLTVSYTCGLSLIGTAIYMICEKYSWILYSSLEVLTLISLIAPTISLIYPGFSYKGHPGKRHFSTLVSGSLIIIVAASVVLAKLFSEQTFEINEKVLLMVAFPLYGFVCVTQYWSFFKGPTSRFGRLFQPYVPTINE